VRPHQPEVHLPEGRHIAITWEIPDNFGGLTKAMLMRSCHLAQHGGVEVQVLTFRHQPDLDAIRDDLRRRGLLVPGVELVNLWEQLGELDDIALAAAPFDPTVEGPLAEAGPSAQLVEVRRPDGTLLGRQRWLRVGERTVLTPDGDWVDHTELYAPDGRFLGGWHGSWSLWTWWLAEHLGGERTYGIVDSAYIGPALAVDPVPGLVTAFLFHNAHLAARRVPPFGPLGRLRKFVSEQSEGFDAFVFLTAQQREDFEILRGQQPNVHVVPNSKNPPTTRPPRRRDANQGLVMANYEPRKRLDHAIRALTTAATSEPSLSLRMFGAGPERDTLAELVESSGAPVTVDGYTSDPQAEFARSSFMLLTSTHEGLPLVLAEAMAVGCVPIAYDVPYGPADVITDGVDGVLVPAGDVDAMARAIVDFVAAGKHEHRRMRAAAVERAKAFDPVPILRRWADVLREAGRRHQARSAPRPDVAELSAHEHRAMIARLDDLTPSLELVDARWSGSVVRLLLRCGASGAATTAPAQVSACLAHAVTGRRLDVEVVPRPDVVDDDPRVIHIEAVVDVDLLGAEPDHVLLVTLEVPGQTVTDTVRRSRTSRRWLPLPPAAPRRPVLELRRGVGLALAVASPKVAGEVVAVDDTTLKVTAASLVGGTVSGVVLVGLGGEQAIVAEEHDASWRLRVPSAGRWKLQALLDGRRRDVCWRDETATLLDDPDAGLHLSLTGRGYVRVTRD